MCGNDSKTKYLGKEVRAMAFKKSTSITLTEPTAIFTGSAIIAGATAQAEFGTDRKPTGNQVAVRVTALSKELGTLTIDLVPYSAETEKRMSEAFGSVITAENLVKASECKIYTYDGELKVRITARDITF